MSKEKLSVWETLSRIDCSKYVEKKGRFNYLSWAWAWSILKENYPTASFEYKKTDDGKTAFVDDTENGFAFVRVAVTVEDQTIEEDLAIMDNYNNDIKNPKPTDINASLKRCLVKALAFHGLGINVYAGEDTLMFDVENKDVEDKVELTKDGRNKLIEDIREYMSATPVWAEAVFKHFSTEEKQISDVDKMTNEQIILTHGRIPIQEKK